MDRHRPRVWLGRRVRFGDASEKMCRGNGMSTPLVEANKEWIRPTLPLCGVPRCLERRDSSSITSYGWHQTDSLGRLPTFNERRMLYVAMTRATRAAALVMY